MFKHFIMHCVLSIAKIFAFRQGLFLSMYYLQLLQVNLWHTLTGTNFKTSTASSGLQLLEVNMHPGPHSVVCLTRDHKL